MRLFSSPRVSVPARVQARRFPRLLSYLLPCFPGKTAAAVALSMLLTAGCASLAPTPPHATANGIVGGNTPQRSYAGTLDLSGRLSVQYQRDNNDEALHGNFNWQQNGTHSKLSLLSPLGQILATIDTGPDGATLVQPGHATQNAADVDALAAQALGWPLPVSGLRSWLQGFATAADGKPFIASADGDHVVTRDGWQIQYVGWQDEQDAARSHPRRIDLTRQTAQAGTVAIRIVIDNWQAR
jgi:outer membrane lipoprotein LolB